MLSAKTIQTIKAITPAVAANAETITKTFYARMFRDNPEVREFFNPAHQQAGSQPKALATALAAYFTHIENPAVLLPAIEVIAQKHCSLQILPEHYPIVGRNLLAAIKDVFDEAANVEVLEAVGEAYELLAKICIDRERQIYEAQMSQHGGWNGFRDFVVAAKVRESDCVYSFYLEPCDHGALPVFKPGQYTTVRLEQLQKSTPPRNYSLSNNPGGDSFRISVKREEFPGVPRGLVSNFLHDHVNAGDRIQLAPPTGEFYFDPQRVGDAPVVFLAGGIGVTPLLSMAKFLVASGSKNHAHFLLASRNSKTCAFANELRHLTKSAKAFRTVVYFDEPLSHDFTDGFCDYTGRINREVLADLPYREAHFYVCGPRLFMKNMLTELKALGVCDNRQHFEFFGPLENLQ